MTNNDDTQRILNAVKRDLSSAVMYRSGIRYMDDDEANDRVRKAWLRFMGNVSLLARLDEGFALSLENGLFQLGQDLQDGPRGEIEPSPEPEGDEDDIEEPEESGNVVQFVPRSAV